jgi:hypothetical protein
MSFRLVYRLCRYHAALIFGVKQSGNSYTGRPWIWGSTLLLNPCKALLLTNTDLTARQNLCDNPKSRGMEETITVTWAETVFVVEASWWKCCIVSGCMNQWICVCIMRSTERHVPWTETCGWEVEMKLVGPQNLSDKYFWSSVMQCGECCTDRRTTRWVWHRIIQKNKQKFLEEHDTPVLTE